MITRICGLQHVKQFNTESFEVKHAREIESSELNTIDYPVKGNV